jgi:hypothetical protein
VQTLTLSLRTRLVTGTLLERITTGIRRWSGDNRDADGTAETQLREHARHSGLACATLSRRSPKNPYLLVWKDERDNEIKDGVRLARGVGALEGYVELKRANGSTTILRLVWRMLPRNGGRALFLLCPYCDTPRRHVYGWEWDSFSGWSNRVKRTDWCCRSCNRLRYSSEGGYLRQGVRAERLFAGIGFPGKLPPLPRPEPWLPYVFISPEEAAEAGICAVNP